MSRSKYTLPTLLAILLSISPALAQQDKEDLRRAIESLKAAINQLQAAVAQLEKFVADEPTQPATTLGDTPTISASGKLGPDEIVFLDSDRYYHREGCAQIRRGVIQMAHSRAHVSYFTCTTCKPDAEGPVSYSRGSVAPAPVIFGRPSTGTAVMQTSSERPDGTIVYINFGEVQYHFRGCPRIRPGDSFERTLKQAKVPFMLCMTCSKLENVGVSSSDSGGATAADGTHPTTTGQQKDLAPVNTTGTVQVKGYYRKDGTYVRPHSRSAPGTKRKKP